MSRVKLEIIACRSDIARSLPDSCSSSVCGPITVLVRVAELIYLFRFLLLIYYIRTSHTTMLKQLSLNLSKKGNTFTSVMRQMFNPAQRTYSNNVADILRKNATVPVALNKLKDNKGARKKVEKYVT
jgi:hypothetical protein